MNDVKYKITSDGSASGTKILDANGDVVPWMSNVSEVEWKAERGFILAKVHLMLVEPEVDVQTIICASEADSTGEEWLPRAFYYKGDSVRHGPLGVSVFCVMDHVSGDVPLTSQDPIPAEISSQEGVGAGTPWWSMQWKREDQAVLRELKGSDE